MSKKIKYILTLVIVFCLGFNIALFIKPKPFKNLVERIEITSESMSYDKDKDCLFIFQKGDIIPSITINNIGLKDKIK